MIPASTAGHHAALRAALAAAAHRLTDRVLAAMLADPFWSARFGERARTHGRDDGLHHLAYLSEALAVDDPGVMTRYARWLQQVLTSRGMCTHHLADNLARLARAIAKEPWPERAAAIAMLDAAGAALAYPPGAARAVQDAAGELVGAVTARTGAPRGAATVLVSYVADAVALGGPASLVMHVTWLTTTHSPAAVPAPALRAQLAALHDALAAQPVAAAIIDAALAALP